MANARQRPLASLSTTINAEGYHARQTVTVGLLGEAVHPWVGDVLPFDWFDKTGCVGNKGLLVCHTLPEET